MRETHNSQTLTLYSYNPFSWGDSRENGKIRREYMRESFFVLFGWERKLVGSRFFSLDPPKYNLPKFGRNVERKWELNGIHSKEAKKISF